MLEEAASTYVSLAAEPGLQPDCKHGQGFALMSPEKKREVSIKGGRASAQGKGHKWTREEAQCAGRKSGRSQTLNDDQIALACRLYEEKTHSIQEICQAVGISKSVLYAYLHRNNR
jgi:general stress protein YciG